MVFTTGTCWDDWSEASPMLGRFPIGVPESVGVGEAGRNGTFAVTGEALPVSAGIPWIALRPYKY